MGFLRDLPFKNLDILELNFGNLAARNTGACGWQLAVWIGWYLGYIRIKDMAKNVAFRDEHPRVERVLQSLMETHFDDFLDL